jgi:hypothetical protein
VKRFLVFNQYEDKFIFNIKKQKNKVQEKEYIYVYTLVFDMSIYRFLYRAPSDDSSVFSSRTVNKSSSVLRFLNRIFR